MNIYEAEKVLELFEHYDEEILKKQYRIMSRKYHPDNCKQNGINEKIAEQKIKEINLANKILTNHLKYNGHCNIKSNNYYDNNKSSEYNKLQTIIINDLEQKLKLNKLALPEFKQLILKFNADSTLNKCTRFMEVLHLRCISFNSCFFEDHQILNNEYQKYILRYKKDLYNIYYDFCEGYLIKYVNEFEQYNWLLEKRNQNKEFLLLSEVVSEINNDLELLMLRKNEECIKKIKDNIDEVLRKYKNYVYYEYLNDKINELKEDTLIDIMLTIKENDSFDTSIKNKIEEFDNKINQLFHNYTMFLELRSTTIFEFEEKLSKNKRLTEKNINEIKYLINKLESEYNEVKFNELTEEINLIFRNVTVRSKIKETVKKKIKSKKIGKHYIHLKK